MRQFGATLQRLGGPGAVTWWAFFVSLADRLITVSVQPINAGAPASARIAATLIAQVAMFAPLVLLRFTLLRDPLRPRPWVALAGFAFADVLRAIVVDYLLHVLGGLPLMPALRIFSGFIPTLIPLLVTAYVVNTFRERQRELAALLEIRDQLERSREDAESAVQSRNDDLIQRVRGVMEAELAALSGQQPGEVVARLQRTASEVVRPLSHELATSFAVLEGTASVEPTTRVGWRQVVGEGAIVRPLRPLLTAVLLSGIWLSAAAVFVPVRSSFLISLLLIPVVLWAGNVLLRAVLPPMGPLSRIGVVLATCLLVGVIIGAIVRVLTWTWQSSAEVSIAAGFYVAGVSAGLAVVSGVLAARIAILEETAVTVEELRAQVLRTNQLQWFHQRGLSRALHGPVQSAVTAAALRLDEASRLGPIAPEVVDTARTELLDVLDVLAEPNSAVATVDEGIARIVGTWSGVCAIEGRVDPEVTAALDADHVARACVLDVITDAVSNAVRHGGADLVDLALDRDGDAFRLVVADNGMPKPGPSGRGLGTALLEECAIEWELIRGTQVGHRLEARFPWPVPVSLT